MTLKQARTLTPDEDFVLYNGTRYKFAGMREFPGGAMIAIYDDPPTPRVALLQIYNVKYIAK